MRWIGFHLRALACGKLHVLTVSSVFIVSIALIHTPCKLTFKQTPLGSGKRDACGLLSLVVTEYGLVER